MRYRVEFYFGVKEYFVEADNEDQAEKKAIAKFKSETVKDNPIDVEIFLLEKIKLEYVNIDSHNRPVFKEIGTSRYFGCVDILFPFEESESSVKKKISVENLSFFGNFFNCEPVDGYEVPGALEIVWRDNK